MNDSTAPSPGSPLPGSPIPGATITVVHRSLPGPWSSDPRDRQAYRRILDLLSLGTAVTVVPIEAHLPGGAPAALRAAGAHLELGPRESVTQRIRRLAPSTDCWYLTEVAITEGVLDALESVEGPLVIDVDHLRSDELRLGAAGLRDGASGGLATEIDHVEAFERRLLARATVAVCSSRTAAASVRQVLGQPGSPGHHTDVRVIAPTAPALHAEPATDAAPGGLVLCGRFSDEFATPDETVARRLLDGTSTTPRLALAGEDTVPLLRRGFARGFEVLDRRDAWPIVRRAHGVLDVRPHGVATTARRAELAAAGVAFVASTAALGDTALPGAAGALHSDDAEEQLELLVRLDQDPRLRAAVALDLRELGAATDPVVTRAQLTELLEHLGLHRDTTVTAAFGCRDERDAVEYRSAPVGGTLAAADPRIAQLEAEMVPLRLHPRDVSINLQSTMDADQRYRVFARTHLADGPALHPPVTAQAEEIGFSILVPTWNSDPQLLDECLRSVQDQQHQNWELCIVDDGSTSTEHLDLLRRRSAEDPRIRVRENPWNQGIALATNDALDMASGDWIVLLDHDDTLKPDALAWVATYATRCPDYDLWYSDEDKIGLDGRLVMPFFKPDWSPDLLMGVNYVCHLLCVRRELMHRVGGFRAGFDGAQDFDLVLRLTEVADRVGHISKPLYSWRMVEGSTALDTGSKPKAHLAGHRALRDALARRGEPGVVEDGHADTTHVVHHSVDTSQLLTIMVPTRDRVDLLRACVERLALATGGVRYELLVVDNQSSDPETLDYLAGLEAEGHQVVRYPHEFSFARQIDLGALHARGDLLLILNNDALARNHDWLLRMMEHAQRPEVGLVGARLMFPEDQRDGRPQHEGIVMGMAGLAYNIDLGGYMGLDQFVRDCSSVTAACVMLRTSVLRAVGGMEERLRVAYNDVDFGLRISELGYRVVYTPHAVLEHPESASRGSLHPTDDEEWLIERWGTKGELREPFMNPHFEWLMPVFYRL
jgi:GT2 family glycosyltransferase